jgi:hypothetical protein
MRLCNMSHSYYACTTSGAWCVVRGAWCVVRGAWCVVRGAWCVVRGAWCVVRGAWKMMHPNNDKFIPSILYKSYIFNLLIYFFLSQMKRIA